MNGSFLVDTNILVYAYDRSEMIKKIKARNILEWLESHAAGVLSTQILAEFFWAITRKLAQPIPPAEGYAQLQQYLSAWRTVDITSHIVLEAARGSVAYQLPFWDAQVWAAAKLNQIPRVLSEDFGHRSKIEGVEFINPFLPGFLDGNGSSRSV